MGVDEANEPNPDPKLDGICQKSLCEILGVSERTGSLLARAGKLRRFEHGIPGCGHRKYSVASWSESFKCDGIGPSGLRTN